MRVVLFGLAVVMTVLSAGVEPASAQGRAWCIQAGRGGPGGGLNECSFYTLEQCRASIGGGLDRCFQNPNLAWDRLEGRHTQPPRRPARERGN